jgi:hypothetical protein
MTRRFAIVLAVVLAIFAVSPDLGNAQGRGGGWHGGGWRGGGWGWRGPGWGWGPGWVWVPGWGWVWR